MGVQGNELTIEQIQSVLDAESDLYDFFERAASAGWPVTKQDKREGKMKMKATDLMIGDLVTYTGDDEGPITASIEGINEDSDFGIEILGTCERIEDIEPIHLTAEILKKNGSMLNEEDDRFEYDDYHNFIFVQFSRNHDTDEIINESFSVFNGCNCQYVHELQHALRICGLDDLADNFKI